MAGHTANKNRFIPIQLVQVGKAIAKLTIEPHIELFIQAVYAHLGSNILFSGVNHSGLCGRERAVVPFLRAPGPDRRKKDLRDKRDQTGNQIGENMVQQPKDHKHEPVGNKNREALAVYHFRHLVKRHIKGIVNPGE